MDVTQEALYQVWRRPTPTTSATRRTWRRSRRPSPWAYTQGIMNGTSATTLSPARTISRVQVAVMLMRFDGAYGEVLLQQAVLALVNEAQAQEGLAP